ncbi:MAG TPA: hypothetical protein VGR34_06125 [Candidatus Dormibacteraeota bacterium]|nr:hypothetical protein [Candidatus Dormibacteraeota bacterium]
MWRICTAFSMAFLLALMPTAGRSAAPAGIKLSVVMAQVGTGHTGTLSWTLSTDDTPANCAAPSTCSQNIYRAPSSCSAVPLNLTKYASVLSTAIGYVDLAPLFGNSCYAVSFIVNAVESSNSNTSGGSLSPAPPTGLTATVK